MYALMIYSLKVGACLAVFYLFFKWLLSRETFHRFNRIVVLGAMLLSFVLPLCVITVYREAPALPDIPIRVIETPAVSAEMPSQAPFPWESVAGWIYALGAVAMLLATLRSLLGVQRIIRRGRREPLPGGRTLVVLPQAVTPFSWGRYIVLSEEDLARNGEAILRHEEAHLRLHHSVDLLVTDLAGCLQWFNPAMWLLRRELRAIHEFEADEAVLASGVDARHYQMLLIRKAAGRRWYSVANSFNHSNLKNRITMMLRKKSSRWAAARALLLLPLAGMALGAFAETRYVFVPAGKDTQNLIKELDARTKLGPESPATIHIRGVETPDPEKQPLILVDGKRVSTLDTLRPEQIAWISVLKDSVSRSMYGDDAKHGVIIVSLKKEGDAPEGTSSVDTPNGGSATSVANKSSMNITIMRSDAGSSISGSGLDGNPVIVVDGERYTGDLNDLDVQRIKSMSIYKGNIPEKYREWVGPENNGVIEIILKSAEESAAELQDYFQSDAWKQAQQMLAEGNAYFQSDEWKQAQKKLAEGKAYFQSDEWKQAQRKLAESKQFFESNEWKEMQQTLKRLGDMELHGDVSGLSSGPASDSHTPSDCNTVLGATGGAMVTGPDVTSKTRSTDEGSVTVVKGRVTADFSQISDADYRIEIDGAPATKADLERLEPGKIKNLELVRNTEALGKQGVLRVRTRK